MGKLIAWAAVPLLALAGCQMFQSGKKGLPDEAMPDLTPALVDYTDTDGFDAVFESHLVANAPAVVVRTEHTRPDWEGRLNAWIAAWNQGGKGRPRAVRGQPGLSRLDADGLRELRLLIDSLFARVETAAVAGSAWYANERERSRRVALLRSYSLRFHRDGDGPIQLVFFHGAYASYYPKFLRSLTRGQESGADEWARTVECSMCEKGRPLGKLVNRE